MLMSKRTRTMNTHFSGGGTPGYLGLSGGKGIYVGAPDNDSLFSGNQIDEGDIGGLRELSISGMTSWLGNKPSSNADAINVIDSSLRSTKEWLKESDLMSTKFGNSLEKVEKTFYTNIALFLLV